MTPKRALALIFLLSLLSMAHSPVAAALAQPHSANAVKTAFIFNILKFVSWPTTTQSKELTLCALGDDPLDGQLSYLVKRRVGNRKIRLISNPPADAFNRCDALFIPHGAEQALSQLGHISAAPVLTISDSATFIDHGGMIGLPVQAGRVRLEVNRNTIQEANLRISSELLQVASKVAP
ncbi:YfiR family protein [Magnetofaba australis]|nr:YfiR family protein [Magnetofaba australis]